MSARGIARVLRVARTAADLDGSARTREQDVALVLSLRAQEAGRGRRASVMGAPTDCACPACLRRAWLLETLSARLAYRAREPERLLQALALADEELIKALGGRRKAEFLRAPRAVPTRPAATGRGSAADLPPRSPLPERAARRGRRAADAARGGRHRAHARAARPTDGGDRGHAQGERLRHGGRLRPRARLGGERHYRGGGSRRASRRRLTRARCKRRPHGDGDGGRRRCRQPRQLEQPAPAHRGARAAQWPSCRAAPSRAAGATSPAPGS